MFALRMLFPRVLLHTMWSGKSPQLLCILPFGMPCLSAISRMPAKTLLAVCMFGGHGGLNESGLRVFREPCPVMSHVNCGDYGKVV